MSDSVCYDIMEFQVIIQLYIISPLTHSIN